MNPPVPTDQATPIKKEALEAQQYFPDATLVTAVNLAWELEMPLLLTGEPGTGKTVFARAVAQVLGQARELRCDVRSDSTARDLLYAHDAVARFADAQGLQQERAAEARHYIRLNGLGEALAWSGPDRPVLLVDEIDKAPRDLPNDLLRELEEGRFEIPEILDDRPGERLQRHMGHAEERSKPLVIITSNAERQLPDPFLRRCIFHHVAFPDAARLMQIVRAKGFRGPPRDETDAKRRDRLVEQAVPMFEALREQRLVKKPATSELVQWTMALDRMFTPAVVDRRLEQALDALTRRAPVPWTALPALPCLVKLRDDLEVLAAGTADG